jgi:acetylornithine deacetylase/succinyl-diaminopimelate desuccinylase-like protein
MSIDTVRAKVREIMPAIRADLEDLVRIESVSADPARAGEVERSAEATAALFTAEGFTTEIVRAYDGAPPAVIGEKAGPPGSRTVLLYAHHDVQPENDHADWDSPPYVPTERAGRLYGRGAADDKAGIAAHLAAIRVFGDDLPVTVKLFVEGEEEVGSDTLPALLAAHQDKLAADVIVIADSGNWDIGVPALTTSLRGLVRADIEVRTLTHAVHSGMWGGLVPDSLITLSRLIATLHDDEGNVTIAGLHEGPAADVEYPEERLRAESGAVPGIRWIGSGPVVERLWTKPALSITGLDAPKVDGASNTLVPAARARISLRIAPGDTTENAVACLRKHLEERVPWGAELSFTVVDTGEATAIDATGPAYDAARAAFRGAWDGTEPVDMGVGGSIPFIAEFLEAFPSASVLVTGVEDPDTRAHGANEGLHLAEFERVCVAEALLLQNLG